MYTYVSYTFNMYSKTSESAYESTYMCIYTHNMCNSLPYAWCRHVWISISISERMPVIRMSYSKFYILFQPKVCCAIGESPPWRISRCRALPCDQRKRPRSPGLIRNKRPLAWCKVQVLSILDSHICMYVCIHMYVCMYVYICMYIYICVCTPIYVHIYI